MAVPGRFFAFRSVRKGARQGFAAGACPVCCGKAAGCRAPGGNQSTESGHWRENARSRRAGAFRGGRERPGQPELPAFLVSRRDYGAFWAVRGGLQGGGGFCDFQRLPDNCPARQPARFERGRPAQRRREGVQRLVAHVSAPDRIPSLFRAGHRTTGLQRFARGGRSRIERLRQAALEPAENGRFESRAPFRLRLVWRLSGRRFSQSLRFRHDPNGRRAIRGAAAI